MTPDARAERIAVKVRGFYSTILYEDFTGGFARDALASAIEAALLSHGDAKIEEAAKVADAVFEERRREYQLHHLSTDDIWADAADDIATKIRALKSAPVNPAEQETERE